jgi:hypothetical protein
MAYDENMLDNIMRKQTQITWHERSYKQLWATTIEHRFVVEIVTQI